jgi:hypothetical protein
MNHQDTKTPIIPVPAETDRVAKQVVDAAFKVHSSLGPGLLITFNVPVIKSGITRLAL